MSIRLPSRAPALAAAVAVVLAVASTPWTPQAVTVPSAASGISGAATATTATFEGSFSGDGITLHLRYDGVGKRFVGSLVECESTFPVELIRESASVLSGFYASQGMERALVVRRSGATFVVQRGTRRSVVRRVGKNDDTLVQQRLAAAFASEGAVGGGAGAPLLGTGSAGVADSLLADTLLAGGLSLPGTQAAGQTGAGADVPAFVRTGMRIIYEASSSSTPANTSEGGTGGVAFEQLTITGVQSGYAAIEIRLLAIDLTARAVWHLSSDGYVVAAKAAGEYWASPPELAAMKDGTVSDVTTVHGPYTLNGRTYNAVRITTPTQGGFTQYTFDVDSGMLLITGVESVDAKGTKVINQKRFVSMRQTAYPWASQKATSAITGLRSADWSGTYGLKVDTFNGTYPLSQHWAVTRADALTVQMKESTTLDMRDGRGPQTVTLAKTRPIPTLWIDPAVLARLRKGQVVDDDPTTGLRTVVSGTQNGMLVLTESGTIQTTSTGFDLRTGLLVAVQTEHRQALSTTTVFLQRTK